MPPKKADNKQSAAKAKIVEDKTFGLKNKNKSSKVQKYVQQLVASQKPVQKPVASSKDKKKAEEAAARELASLFTTAIKQPKAPPGVDPKSIVCEYFRVGQCVKGTKCKYSHDLSVERKGAKMDLYADKRDTREEGEDNMEDWDQETLEKAIAEKHGKENRNQSTDIVCRYFLEAVEKKQYGWFWVCPNGKDCKYRHALPPGYVLKSQMKQMLEEEAANSKSVEEIIEEERAKVDAKTPITDAVFKQWKTEQDEAHRQKAAAALEERRRRGEGFVATDDASASDAYARDVDEDEEIKRMHSQAAEAEAEAQAAAAATAVAAKLEADEGRAGPSPGTPTGQGDQPAGTEPQAALTQEEEEELFAGVEEDEEDDDDGLLDELADELSKAKV